MNKVVQIRKVGRGDSRRHSRVLEDCASRNLHDARRGVPGIYRVDPSETETVFFQLNSLFCLERMRIMSWVYPLSLWDSGECLERAEPRSREHHPPFLPPSVLSGNFNESALPEEELDELRFWAEVIVDGVKNYDAARTKHSARRTRGHS